MRLVARSKYRRYRSLDEFFNPRQVRPRRQYPRGSHGFPGLGYQLRYVSLAYFPGYHLDRRRNQEPEK